jgi:hypothetical protein
MPLQPKATQTGSQSSSIGRPSAGDILNSLLRPLADLAPPRRKPERLVASDEFGCDRLRGGQAAHRARDILQHRPVLDARGAIGYQAERNDELDHDGDFPSAMVYAALELLAVV